MKPILFHIGSYPIYGYGLMFGLAFIVCLFIGKIRFKEQKFSDNLAYDFIIIILLASLIGARAFFVFQHTELFDFSLFHIFEKINLWAIIPTCLVAVALYYNTKSIEQITITRSKYGTFNYDTIQSRSMRSRIGCKTSYSITI